MSILVLVTVSAILGAKTMRDGWDAPYRPFRWAVRVASVALPIFLLLSWSAVLTSGGVRQLLDGLALVALVPAGLGSLGMLLAMATAPSRRR